ncbi:chromobox protein 1-like protein [Dinothrombium tinctorium]|uniref:Chromobox protein 1-like protein n=1 Tax=Dinothrombium tinctorium TaxID=1965070 RepID=A0A443REE0_9ACAR|nr:chromobox protein 1-like protein [Dinothrombium tinctorium]
MSVDDSDDEMVSMKKRASSKVFDRSDDENSEENNDKKVLSRASLDSDSEDNRKAAKGSDGGDEDGEGDEDGAGQEEEYVVEKILEKRKRNGRIEYLIKWQGWPDEDNTWEPEEHLSCPDLVREFEEKQRRKKEKRARKEKERQREKGHEKDRKDKKHKHDREKKDKSDKKHSKHSSAKREISPVFEDEPLAVPIKRKLFEDTDTDDLSRGKPESEFSDKINSKSDKENQKSKKSRIDSDDDSKSSKSDKENEDDDEKDDKVSKEEDDDGLTGFDRGLEPKKIVGALLLDGEIKFLIRWKGSEVEDLVPRTEANEKCPQLVIKYYQKRLRWVTFPG